MVHPNPQVFFCGTALNDFLSQTVLMFGTIQTQVWDLELGVVKAHEALTFSTFPVSTAQLPGACKPADSGLNLTDHVLDKGIQNHSPR